MSVSIQVSSHPQLRKALQNRLFFFAAAFLFLFTTAMTLAPMARNHSWQGDLNLKPWIGFAIWLVCYYLAQRMTEGWLSGHDPYLLPGMYLLIGWGNLTIWRLSNHFGLRQSIWLVVGTIIFLVVIRFPQLIELLFRYRYIWLVMCFLLVGVTLLPGIIAGNEQPNLWISIGSLNLQPSEPLKLFLVVYLAAYFSDRLKINPRSWAFLLPSLSIILISILLLLLQRDLGTASLILMLYTFAVYTITGKKRNIGIALLILIAAAIVGFFTIDVIRLRFEAWINPWRDPTSRSYQIVQSLIAQAAGGFLGSGPGMGAPGLVPVAISDFIYTAILEETGLIGGAALVTILLLIFSRAIWAARRAESPFAALLAGGLAMLLIFQSLLIIGGNIRLIPLTGVTLPFVSYGGSSLVVCMASMALIVRISAQSPKSLLSIPIYDSLRTRVLPLVLAAFVAVLVLLPIWSVIQKESLVDRGDNQRKSLSDLYVKRGSIVDRNGQAIDSSSGQSGSYQRDYLYPNLSATVGYAHPLYGLAGIESSFDDTLRGAVGYPYYQLWWNNLLTSQTPPGFDLRLSIDLNFQKTVDQALNQNPGAGILLNADTGEILAVSSSPGFNPATLDTDWNTLVTDPETPLINRAINGQYPVGTATSIFLYAQMLQNNLRVTDMNASTVSYQGKQAACAQTLAENTTDLKELLINSCPQVALSIARTLGKQNLYQTYSRLGFYQIPTLPLARNESKDPGEISNLKTAAVGQENLAVTPLQMALAAATFSADGLQPTPKIVIANQTLSGSWQIVSTTTKSTSIYSRTNAQTVQQLTAMDNLPAWGVVGRGQRGSNKWVTWFIGGTTQDWNGSPLILVLALEQDNPTLASDLGRFVLTQALIQ